MMAMPPQPDNTRGRPSGPDGRPPAEPSSPRSSIALTVPLASRISASAAAYGITDLPNYIASRITVDPASGCWIVGGYHDKDGYARIKGRGAHRVIWEHFNGPVASKLVLDHREDFGCLSKACGWPAHLLPVTNRENCTRNGVSGVAAINAAKTKCDNGHPYDLFNTYFRPDGHRDCRICICERVKKYKRRLREAAKAGELAVPLELRQAA
jgi:hypothetical protein